MPRSALPWPVLATLLLCAGCQTVQRESSDYRPAGADTHSYLDTRLEKLEKLAKDYPKNPEYHYQIAAVKFEMGRWKESAASLRRAIDLDPDQIRYHYHLGRVYLNMNELGLAEASFREAVQRTPPGRYSGPHAALGFVMTLKKAFEPAIAEFLKCVEIDPQVPEFYYLLGALHDLRGDREQAIRYFREYLDCGGTLYRQNAIFILDRLGVRVEVRSLPQPAAAPSSPATLPFGLGPEGGFETPVAGEAAESAPGE
jgi:tetratricopeptide (TPR) repeat protein